MNGETCVSQRRTSSSAFEVPHDLMMSSFEIHCRETINDLYCRETINDLCRQQHCWVKINVFCYQWYCCVMLLVLPGHMTAALWGLQVSPLRWLHGVLTHVCSQCLSILSWPSICRSIHASTRIISRSFYVPTRKGQHLCSYRRATTHLRKRLQGFTPMTSSSSMPSLICARRLSWHAISSSLVTTTRVYYNTSSSFTKSLTRSGLWRSFLTLTDKTPSHSVITLLNHTVPEIEK
jgi:hypothetical protein